MEQHREGIVSWDRALVGTWSFPGISGIIQLVVLWPQGHGMTLKSYCHVGSEVLAHPTSFYLGSVGARCTQVLLCPQICSTVDAEPRGCTSLLMYGLSLLFSALEAVWLLWSSVLGCGHHQSLLCCCPHVATSCSQSLCSLLLHCQRKDSMFLFLLQIMKMRFIFFFLSNRILGSDQVEKSKL